MPRSGRGPGRVSRGEPLRRLETTRPLLRQRLVRLDLLEAGSFLAESVELSLDKLTWLIQQVMERTGGSSYDAAASIFMSLTSTNS